VHDLLRAFVDGALLPHQAAVALDAIIRVCYRRMISRRDLLEWTAQSTHWRASLHQPLFLAHLALGSLFSMIVGTAIWLLMPTSLPVAAVWLVLWFFSPLFGWLLNLRPIEQRREKPLPETGRRFLRQVARRTWRYFRSYRRMKPRIYTPSRAERS